MVAATTAMSGDRSGALVVDRTAIFENFRRSYRGGGAPRRTPAHIAFPDESQSFLSRGPFGASDSPGTSLRPGSPTDDSPEAAQWRLWTEAKAALDARMASVAEAVRDLAAEHERDTAMPTVDWAVVTPGAPLVEAGSARSRAEALVRKLTRLLSECRVLIRELTEGVLAQAMLDIARRRGGDAGAGRQVMFMLNVRNGMLARLGTATAGLLAIQSVGSMRHADGSAERASLLGPGISRDLSSGGGAMGANPFLSTDTMSPADSGAAQLQAHALPAADAAFLEEREREVALIEASALQICDVVREMQAHAVRQGTLLDSVEFNISVVQDHVVRAHAALVRRQRAQYAAQGRKLLLLAVVFMLMLVLIAILAVRSRS